MAPVQPLTPDALCAHCDPAQFSFATTNDVPDLADVVGQTRALAALRFGIGIHRPGYNLFVLGASGTGRHSVVQQFLSTRAAQEALPSDWCYINNFDEPQKPLALRLPSGTGVRLKRDIEQLMNDIRTAIPAMFESEEYRTRRQELEDKLKAEQEQAFEAMRAEAERHSVMLIRTPGGMAFAPKHNDEVFSSDEFDKLPDAEKERFQQIIASLEEQLEHLVHQLPQWRREGQRRIHELDRDMTRNAVEHLIDELKKTWADLPAVLAYLERIQNEVIENTDDFKHGEEGGEVNILGIGVQRGGGGVSTRRYQVNVMVDHSSGTGAPVVYEDNPTFPGLIGRIEHISQMGALVTDFMLLKPGALHRANGGYLILDARKVLLQPFAWEGLKRALSSAQLRMESLGQALSLVSTVSLEPEAIPLDVKVVLIGEPIFYYLLSAYDPEFSELFKVAVDFGYDMQRNAEANQLYAQLIATLARRNKLLALDRAAVARVLDHAARLVEDTEKLTVRMREITDVLREADHWAREAKHAVIGVEDVEQAIDARVYRHDRIRERVQEMIQRGLVMIDTAGARVGQVNGLSVIQLGEFAFGRPERITARVRLGKGQVLDIQREAELSGPIHAKGVMILAAYLGAHYSAERPLALSASLVFEQTYGEVEGDSASSTELYALLSALSGVAIKQSLAVTGSVNQLGEIQAIGGVNEKIEGFFDVCQARGLTGEQGVLIPASNVQNLMLRKDVVQAVANKQFHIYPVRTVDEGIELLTGMVAGERDARNQFADGTLNQLVETRLIALAELARDYSASHRNEAPDKSA